MNNFYKHIDDRLDKLGKEILKIQEMQKESGTLNIASVSIIQSTIEQGVNDIIKALKDFKNG